MKGNQENISIFTLLYKCSPKLFIFASIIGAVAGALYSLIIPFVLRELNHQVGSAEAPIQNVVNQHSAVVFFSTCLLILSAKAFSVIMINNIAKSAVAELRVGIAKKINNMMIANIESIGFPRLLNILTDDVNNLIAAAVAIPMLLVSAVTVIGMLGYLATLNFTIFLIVVFAVVVGVLMFQVPIAMASGLYEKARMLRDTIQEGVRGLVMGVYELKLNREKSIIYIDEELIAPQHELAKTEKIGDMVLHIAGASSDLLSFFIIGVIVFILPNYVHFAASENYGVVMALLYIVGPVSSILGMAQHLKLGQIALDRINKLNHFEDDSFSDNNKKTLKGWSEFSVRGITYSYPVDSDGKESAFSLSPINLSFKAGQINFIVGGNGSGKSTLSKLLSLHYKPCAGGVFFDDELICPENILQARSRMSVIFSNYFLFSRLYGELSQIDATKVNNYLAALHLKNKTELIDGRFTTTRLSDGQRRRLALMVALLEDKEIYIFDEWAADQDPEFKNIFYRKILQDMKRENKLVIVITHDDRYFNCADRVIFMENGSVIDIKEAALSGMSTQELTASPVLPIAELSICD